MEEIEIALALLEIIAILFPLSLVAFGLGFRLVQSAEGRKFLGPFGVFEFVLISGVWLFLLAISAGLLLLFILMYIDSLIITIATVVLEVAFGYLAGYGTGKIISHRRSDEVAASTVDDS